VFLPLWGKARMGVLYEEEIANFTNCYLNCEEIPAGRVNGFRLFQLSLLGLIPL
jgi:hypothetical protein